ncbi:MAG: hypothetical protein QOF00_1711 [Pseudonocardiales bacterium]|jgi:hypothetical protein|nr:hypothetical protein [Pseudonocardiales bacterium]
MRRQAELMPTFIGALPVHVLVVHAVVVLVPLSVLGAIVVSLWPAARRRYGWLVVGVAVVATACIPIATSSGEGLEHRLPRTPLLEVHTHLGDQLLVFVAGMLVFLVAFMVIHQRAGRLGRREGPGTMTGPAAPPRLAGPMRIVAGVLAALTVVLAVVSAVQVYRIGDSGATAAWSGRQYVTQSPGPRPGGAAG